MSEGTLSFLLSKRSVRVSWPADTVAPTYIRHRKIRQTVCSLDEVCHDVAVVNLVIRAHLHPELHVRRSWRSRRADAGLTALSWHGLSCLLRGWVLTHAAGQESAQRRKQQHGQGRHVKKPAPPPTPLTLAIPGQVSPAKLGPEILWKRTDFWKSPRAYFRRGGNAKMDWRVLKAYSHIFHWYQSHMAGFHY